MSSASRKVVLLAGPYKDTVNLPQTSFNMRANSVQREPQIQKFWRDNKVYETCLQDETKVVFKAWACPNVLNGFLCVLHSNATLLTALTLHIAGNVCSA